MARPRTARTLAPRAPRWEPTGVDVRFEVDGAKYRAISDARASMFAVYAEDTGQVAFRGRWIEGQGLGETRYRSRHWYDRHLPPHPQGQQVAFTRVVNAASGAIGHTRLAQLAAVRANIADRRRSMERAR